ncbi:MAG: T9SS type A sorting domain-containing protein, partial [Candidatus Krumholzibacteriota bacterium]|nr:T9SS type A sorting domain-containing protein [Candidatus Krumholzibacteriota bacterium]
DYVHNFPNPFRAGRESTRITYFLTQDSDVSVKIYDLAGNLVWTRDIKAGDEGGRGDPGKTEWKIKWNGRNARGEIVRNGVYICKLQAGSRSAIFKIAVAK